MIRTKYLPLSVMTALVLGGLCFAATAGGFDNADFGTDMDTGMDTGLDGEEHALGEVELDYTCELVSLTSTTLHQATNIKEFIDYRFGHRSIAQSFDCNKSCVCSADVEPNLTCDDIPGVTALGASSCQDEMFSAKFPNESVPMRVFSDDHFDTLQEHIDAVWALGEEKCKAHLFTTSTGYELTCDEQCNDRWPKLFDAEGRHLIRLQKTMTCAVPTHEEFSVELDVEPIVERGEATEISWSVTDDADTANVTCTLSDLDEHGKWQTKWSGGAVLKKTFAYPTAGEVTLKVDCKSPERDFIASDYAHVRVGAPEPTVEVTVNGNLVEDGDIVEVVPEHGDIDGRQLSDILELFQEGEPQSPAGKKVTIKWTAENAVSCTLTDNLIGGTDDFISHFELVPGEPTDPEGERYGNPTGQYSYVSPTARDVFYNDTPSVIKSLRPRAEVAERELSENESIFGYGRPIRRALKLECLNEDDESAAVHFQLCTTAWWNKESKDETLQCLNTL